ncbi:MAG TPA: ABC transporter permease [Candidatus Acidoferrales bacterium]|nr:ABC transporter permease [Candidatus Acidoferrales bacterium]
MFVRLITDSFRRQARRKLLTTAALALGTAIATATLTVALDVGDRLAREFRSLGANLVVTPEADTLPLEIGGVDYRPVDSGVFLSESDLGKLKTIFWRNNIIGFAPFLDVPVTALVGSSRADSGRLRTTLIGTWYRHDVAVPGGGTFATGISATNPGWKLNGRWFSDNSAEAVAGANLARRAGIHTGDSVTVQTEGASSQLVVTGIISTGGQEDDAILAPLTVAQALAHKPGDYRRLLVSALTKPEDAFSQRNPKSMSPEEFDRWYCSPYISSISRQIQEQFPGVNVRAIRQVAEGEGQILSRVQSLMWLVTFAALLAAALAVAATAGTTVLERTGEVALMKALGARQRLVGAFFLGEQWFMAIVGGVLGYTAGLGLAHALGQRIFGIAPGARLILLPVVLALAAAVATIGSLLPLRKIMKLDPAPVLRGE